MVQSLLMGKQGQERHILYKVHKVNRSNRVMKLREGYCLDAFSSSSKRWSESVKKMRMLSFLLDAHTFKSTMSEYQIY